MIFNNYNPKTKIIFCITVSNNRKCSKSFDFSLQKKMFVLNLKTLLKYYFLIEDHYEVVACINVPFALKKNKDKSYSISKLPLA